MLNGKKGFTVLELLVVMLITAVTLPVVGTAFYMMLHVPAKETGKLSTINDVNLALSWIHQDINRGQFFSGAPGMLKGITTIDFSSGAGTDQQAWEKLGIPGNPSDQGTDLLDYTLIAASDTLQWESALADTDGQIETQMFQFTIPVGGGELIEDLDEIETMVVSWKGSGEDEENDTEIKIWNATSHTWDEFNPRAYRNEMGSEGWLSGRITNVQDYITVDDPGFAPDNTVYVLAMTTFYEGCPFLYGWDGEGYALIDATLNDAFLKRFETSGYQIADVLEPIDGNYDLMLHMGLPETGYINNLGLRVVDHPEGTRILAEHPADAEQCGRLHTISQLQPVTAVDSRGNDITELLSAEDGDYWGSDLSGRDFSRTEDLYDWIVITLPEERDSGSAKLVLDVRETGLGEFQLWYFSHFLLGTPNLDFVLNRIETDEEFIPYFDLQLWLSSAFIVQYRNGSEWVDYASVPSIGPYFGSPEVVTLDLSKITGKQIRLHTPAGLREIDYIAVDYSEDKPVDVTQIAPTEATQHFADGSAADVLADISVADDRYAVIEQGDYINYRFPAMNPPAEGMQRTFVLCTGGYYYLEGPEVPEDKMGNLDLAEELTYVPYSYAKWTLPRYADPDSYPYSGYYQMERIYPEFPRHITKNTIITDYIKLVVLTPGESPEYEVGETYGGFYWVDRTGSEDITYTTHYYWSGANTTKLLRQEWQNNGLASVTALAHNVQNYDDIQFTYYPAGTTSGEDILPYIIVNIKTSTGAGNLYTESFGSSHIALRSTTLSRGAAVLAKETVETGSETVNISGSNLIIDGSVRSFGNITVTGEDNLITGRAEANAYIWDELGAVVDPHEFEYIDDVDWDLDRHNLIQEPSSPASHEYIWIGGDVTITTSLTTDSFGKEIWDSTDASAPVLNQGVYYLDGGGNLTLTTDNVTGMVTLASEGRVRVTSDNSYLSPFCNGVILFSNSSYDDAVEFSGDGGAWSGNLFAPEGGVMVSGTMTQKFFLFGAVAAQRFDYRADSQEEFRVKF